MLQYTLKNCKGMTVQILSYGAITQSITVPDKNGNLTDVILGFKTLNDYVTMASPPPNPNSGGPYFGETIGRYANRIGTALVQAARAHLHAAVNNGVNSLHGGFVGCGNHVWA